jgi:CDP-diacylglycerol--serine O-phosphatidyltransferase
MMKKHHKSNNLPIFKLFPSLITLATLFFGTLAVYHSTMMHWERACFFIIIAAIFDVLDGRFARILNAQSAFGANLDSLCDFANYTIFPSIIIYNWSLWNHGLAGWSAVMISSLCGAIRLARFNVSDAAVSHPIKKMFFVGIPSPSAGILILLPLLISISFDLPQIQYPPFYLYEVYIAIVSISMITTMPTLSLKYLKIPRKYTPIILFAFGFVLISFIIFKLQAVVMLSIAYIICIPIVLLKYSQMMKNYNKNHKNAQ